LYTLPSLSSPSVAALYWGTSREELLKWGDSDARFRSFFGNEDNSLHWLKTAILERLHLLVEYSFQSLYLVDLTVCQDESPLEYALLKVPYYTIFTLDPEEP
jgi:hypothetical protein